MLRIQSANYTPLLCAYFICATIILTNKYIGHAATQIAVTVVLIVIFAIIDTLSFKHFFREEFYESLGWQRMWTYPSHQIIAAYLITFISVIVVLAISYSNRNTDSQSITVGIVTGIAASGMFYLFTETANNYENNMKRMAILSDYFCVIYYYNEDIDLYQNMVQHKIKKDGLKQIDIDAVKDYNSKISETFYNEFEYSAVHLQSIACEIAEYRQLISDTLCNHSELLYREEILSLKSITYAIQTIQYYLSEWYNNSNKLEDNKKGNSAKGDNCSPILGNHHAEEEEMLNSILLNLSQVDDISVLSVIVQCLISIDKDIKKLNRQILYLKDKDYIHLKHILEKTRRFEE